MRERGTMSRVENLERQQRNIDEACENLKSALSVKTPKKGWIREIRESMGMTAKQLGRKIVSQDNVKGIAGNSVIALENTEMFGNIKLDTLKRAANALGCDVVYGLVPREPINEKFRSQLDKKVDKYYAQTIKTLSDDEIEMLGEDLIKAEITDQILSKYSLWN